ncbi:hypothetical protein OIDMADRAFT_184344 [Oidiodendron maius Zn]|uniref:Uncharacterized protein n=1 Tax=Oidiodendron maius (strain Zn) TaxID=913774 RepID=A0A0C3GU07_OIDMZ|nr:hypothetical protein OIDMADRAFT_184344 [Oidiodendron maius Zn]
MNGGHAAYNVQATYALNTQELTISADINLIGLTWGIEFARQPWRSGYKFAPEGWIWNPITPYTKSFSQTFKFPWAPRFLSHTLVCTQEHPEGEQVDVHVIGGVIPPSKDLGTASPEQTLIEYLPDMVTITVAFGETFNIKQSAEADIIEADIVWTFKPLAVGQAQIIVTRDGGLAQWVMSTTYTVNIIIPLEPGPVIPTGSTDPKGSTGVTDVLPPLETFLSRVARGREMVEASFPDSTLVEVRAWTLNMAGVESPTLLSHMLLTFRSAKENKAITIKSVGIGHWGIPQISTPPPPVGILNISWPVDFQAETADKMLKDQGQVGPYLQLTLTMPGGVPDPNFPPTPTYTFYMTDGKIYPVNLWLHKDATTASATEWIFFPSALGYYLDCS